MMHKKFSLLKKFFLDNNLKEEFIKLSEIEIPNLKDTHIGTAVEKYKEERLDVEPEVIEKLEKELIANYNDYDIYLVNGTEIRNHIDPDFIGGGNSSRYLYIPLDEVWIENSTNEDDVIPYIIHETVEAKAMKEDKMTYQEAHELATEKEWIVRHSEEEKNKKAKEILKK